MTCTARLKVFCDNKAILSKLSYTFSNTTTKQNFGGKIDTNGCTKVYDCNKLDLIFVELLLNNSKLARVRVPALENGEFNKSTFRLKSTTGTTQKTESNKVPVKVKNELEIAIDQWEATTSYIAKETIQNPVLRLTYEKKAKEISNKYIKFVKEKKLSLKEAATECNKLRNEVMEITRKKTTAVGLAGAKNMKSTGLTIDFLSEKYAYQLIDVNDYEKLKKMKQLDPYIKEQMAIGRSFFNELSPAGKNRVYYSIMKSAGNANKKVTANMKVTGSLGTVFLVITVIYAGKEIYYAENREKETIRQTTTIFSGMAAGAATTIAVSSPAEAACGPASPICIFVAGLVGSAVGGWGAYQLLEAYDEELEEFTTWKFF
jgi:hypothetical protein